MIPKILHHMSPNGQLSKVEQNCINSFIQHNPELKVMHWTDDSVTKFIKENYNEAFYDMWTQNIQGGTQARGILKKWDSARLYIINKIGGVWTDSDCTCLKPLDSLFNYDLVIRKPIFRYASIYETIYNFKYTPPHICNAFFACKPNNDILNEIIKNISIRFQEDPLQHVTTATACLLYGEVVQNRIEDKNLGNTKLLDYFEFKEGPERLDWIDKSEFEKMMVIHKINDNTKRYQGFPKKITILEARILSK